MTARNGEPWWPRVEGNTLAAVGARPNNDYVALRTARDVDYPDQKTSLTTATANRNPIAAYRRRARLRSEWTRGKGRGASDAPKCAGATCLSFCHRDQLLLGRSSPVPPTGFVTILSKGDSIARTDSTPSIDRRQERRTSYRCQLRRMIPPSPIATSAKVDGSGTTTARFGPK